MMRRRDWMVFLAACALGILLAWCTAHAGTMTITWEAVQHPGLLHYRVYWGQGSVTPSSSYDLAQPETACAGASCSLKLEELPDCGQIHASVMSCCDDDGDPSGWPQDEGGNNIVVKGWPDPYITSTWPVVANEVQVVTGRNFPPDSELWVDGVPVAVTSVHCERVVLAEPSDGTTFLLLSPDLSIDPATGTEHRVWGEFTRRLWAPGGVWRSFPARGEP